MSRFELYTLFPRMPIAKYDSSEEFEYKTNYIDAAHNTLKQMIVQNNVLFPCDSLDNPIKDVFTNILLAFPEMVLCIVNTEKNNEVMCLHTFVEEGKFGILSYPSFDEAFTKLTKLHNNLPTTIQTINMF